MATLTQKDDRKLLQAKLSLDAYRRIKVRAAMTDQEPGEIVSDLAARYLPPAPPEPDDDLPPAA